jgi:TRAP-type C4-dicarboxylate transport system substrate-binding protein
LKKGGEIQSGNGPLYPSLERRIQMKNNTLFKLSTIVGIILALSTSAFQVAFAASPVEIKAVAFLPTTAHETKFFLEFIEDVQKRSQGQLKIKFLGGPEVISGFELVDALDSGVIQMAMVATTYLEKRVPVICSNYLINSLAGKRKSGFYDMMAELIESKAELRFLGEINPNAGMHIFTNFMAQNPRTDFKGKRIRTIGTYDSFIEGLGAVGVVVPRMDIYSAMERGVINGFFAMSLQILEFGLVDVVKYVVQPQLYWGGCCVGLNLGTWKKLPKDIQKIVQDTLIEKEKKWEPLYDKMDRDAIEKLREKGVKEIKFSPEDEKWFFNLAIMKEWDDAVKKDPVNAKKVKKFVFGN